MYEGFSVYFTNTQKVIVNIPTLNNGTPSSIEYSFDGISWSQMQQWSNSINVLLPSSDGIKSVYVKVFDNNGVQLAQDTTYFVLDTTPPIIESLTTQNGADATSTNSINLNVQVKDNITTAGNFEYSVNGGQEMALPVSGQITVPVNNSGFNSIAINIYDQAGNMSSDSIQVFKLN